MEISTKVIAAFGAGTMLAMLIAHRLLQRLFDPKSSTFGGFLGESSARALREVGDVLAVFLIGPAIVKSCVLGESVAHDVKWCAAFAALGLLLLEGSGVLGLRLLLRKRIAPALDRDNCAAGIAAACHYVAMGILVSRAATGNDVRSIGLALVFFALALVTHQMLMVLFRALTTYDDAEQIEGENLAAAVSYGGLSIALAVVLARALQGDFVDWPSSISGFGLVALTALGFYPLRQIVVQGLLAGSLPTLRGGALDLAIGRDRKVGAAALEAACYVGAALSISLLA